MAPRQARPAGRTWIRAAALVAVVLLVGAVYVSRDRQGNGAVAAVCTPTEERAAALDPLIGGEIAAFQIANKPQSLATLAFTGVDGEAKTLGDFEGKVSLVNLWATWCAPCRREMPALDQLQIALGGDDFEVVPISIDTGDRARPQQFLESIEVTNLPLFTDPSTQIFETMKQDGLAIGLPVTVLLDRNSCILGHMNGPAEWASDDAKRLIEAAIGGSAAPSS